MSPVTFLIIHDLAWICPHISCRRVSVKATPRKVDWLWFGGSEDKRVGSLLGLFPWPSSHGRPDPGPGVRRGCSKGRRQNRFDLVPDCNASFIICILSAKWFASSQCAPMILHHLARLDTLSEDVGSTPGLGPVLSQFSAHLNIRGHGTYDFNEILLFSCVTFLFLIPPSIVQAHPIFRPMSTSSPFFHFLPRQK